MEDKIYQILKKHKLPLKKREEVLTDLLLLLGGGEQSEQFCECDGIQDLIDGTGECRKCGGQCTY